MKPAFSLVCLTYLIKYNKYKAKRKKELDGHINVLETDYAYSPDIIFYSISHYPHGKNGNGGFSYVCYHGNGYYKIGASTSLINRIVSLGYSSSQFICAIETKIPFDLEKYLHNRFREQKKERFGELFLLSEKDIDFIKSIRTIDETEVYCHNNLDELDRYLSTYPELLNINT